MRISLTLALLVALSAPARAGGDVGVLVTGEGSMQPQLTAQIEGWLSQHGRTPVASPLPPDAIPLLVDCFVMEDQACAKGIVEQRAKSTSMIYARFDTKNNTTNGTRDVTLTLYWFDKAHDAAHQTKTCERCTDQSLRTTADDLMKKLLGGGDVGHVKFKSVPAGARIMVDGQAIGVTPLDWDLTPGKHMVQMDKAGLKSQRGELVIASNKTELFGMKLEAPGEDDSGSDRPSRVLPYSLLGAGGALLITGGVLIAIDQDPGPHEPAKIYDTARQGVGLMVGGALIGAAGAYFLWFRSPKVTSAPVAAFTSDTAYIGWLGHF